MSISPIMLNGMVGRTQDISAFKQNEDNKGMIDQGNSQVRVQREVEEHLNTVREQDNADESKNHFDAKNEGNGQYTGDGGKRKHQKEVESEMVLNKSDHGGFDVKI